MVFESHDLLANLLTSYYTADELGNKMGVSERLLVKRLSIREWKQDAIASTDITKAPLVRR